MTVAIDPRIEMRVRSTYQPADIKKLIDNGEIEVIPRRGVHETYTGSIHGFDFFFKDYTARCKPEHMLAERFAHMFAGSSALLFARVPLGGYTIDPASRTEQEARTLTMWRQIGIHAPQVYAHDRHGLVLERIDGNTLEEHLEQGTLTEPVVSSYTDALQRTREAAYVTRDPTLLHTDASLANAILERVNSDGTDRVVLIDPGVVVRNLPLQDIDAASALGYLHNVLGAGERYARIDESEAISESYVRSLDDGVKQLMREHNRPTPAWVSRMIMRSSDPEVAAYGAWLGSYGEGRSGMIDRLL